MKVIGLCGGSGSGKGTVSRFFSKYGVVSIDTDAVYHDITSCSSPCVEELSMRFGADILTHTGGLDRRALAEIVFADESRELLKELNEITHKHILKETVRLIELGRSAGAPAVIIDAPLLFESGFSELCDVIVAVVADSSVRLARIIARDGITADMADKRISSQTPDEKLVELSDYVIRNEGSLEVVELQVAEIVNLILK